MPVKSCSTTRSATSTCKKAKLFIFLEKGYVSEAPPYPIRIGGAFLLA
jgi:hypothetical protein